MGAGGAEGAGGRRALVRARDAPGRRAVRRLLGHAQPDVPRHRRTSRPRRTRPSTRRSGKVLLYNGTVATTYFSSTSGGRTESSAGLDGHRAAVPRLRAGPLRRHLAVPQLGPGPGHGADDREGAELTGPIIDATTTPNAAGRVASSTSSRRSTPVTRARRRRSARRLGLRSTWFTVGVLSLARAGAERARRRTARRVTLGGVDPRRHAA